MEMTGTDDRITAKLATTEPLTQMETVLMMLRARGDSGVCGTDFLEMRIPRYSSRLAELRAEGYHVGRRKCSSPYHSHGGGSVQYQWFLEDSRGPPNLVLF